MSKGKKESAASGGDGARKSLTNAYVRAAKRIGACAQDLRENPADDEALHQYRISLRVARSLVKFARPYQKAQQQKELAELLKELQAPTSRVRELDMLVKHLSRELDWQGCPPTGWRSATNAAAQARDEEPEILAQCRAVQEGERAAFLEAFGKRRTAKKLGRVQELLARPKWRRSARERGLRAKPLRKRVACERVDCEEALRTVDAHDQDAVHTVRKRAKGLRYVTRELSACLPQDSAQTSQDMKAVQDKLGDMLDARVNAQLLRQICAEQGEEMACLFDARADAIADGIG